MIRPRIALVASLLVLSALSARAQEDDPEADPGVTVCDDALTVVGHGHVEAIASSVVFEWIIRGEGEDASSAEETYAKRVKKLVKGLPETSPVASSVAVDFASDKHMRVDGFIMKLERDPRTGQSPARKDGVTYSGRFFLGVHGLGELSGRVARTAIAQVMQKIADNDLTGAEDDVDIIAARMEADAEALRLKSYARALEEAKKRASVLARLSQRKLGRILRVREALTRSNDEQLLCGPEDPRSGNGKTRPTIYPLMTRGWKVSTIVWFETDLVVEFELE